MKIDQKVIINLYPYTDTKTNKIITPKPIELSELNISFIRNDKLKTIFARIAGYPVSIPLVGPQDYSNITPETQDSICENILMRTLGDNPSSYLQSLIPKTLESNPNGPGTILSGMLSSLGIKSAPNCSCKRRALEMNHRGPEWCEAHIELIVNWLGEEAQKRKLPFIRTIAKLIVQRAISKSRRLLSRQNNATS